MVVHMVALEILKLIVVFPESSCFQLKGFEDATNLCKLNEIFSKTGVNCQLSCFTKDLEKLIKCKSASGCICKKGIIRNPINRFAKVYLDCGNCEAKCSEDSKKQTCDNTECYSGCFCKPPNFKTDSITGNCVLKTSCPGELIKFTF